MKKVVLSLGVISLLAVQARAQLLFFDAFEGDTLNAGTSSLLNWNVNATANVDVIGAGSLDFYPGNGKYIDLDGTFSAVPTTITTKNAISLAGGTKYTFIFDLGKNGSASESMTVRVTDGTTNFVNQTISDANSYASLQQQKFEFTTTGATSVNIIFQQNNPADNAGYVLDGIALGVIPEPTTLALFGMMGLPVLALVRRRRNS